MLFNPPDDFTLFPIYIIILMLIIKVGFKAFVEQCVHLCSSLLITVVKSSGFL